MTVDTRVPTDLVFGKRGVQTRDEFVLTQETAQDKLAGEWSTNINQMGVEFNLLAGDMNVKYAACVNYEVATKGYRDTTNNYKNETLLYRNETKDYRDEVMGYVIPTEATLSENEIRNLDQTHRLEDFLGFNF